MIMPEPILVDVIALIRWYANTLENVALQRYLGDRRNLDAIKNILREAHTDLLGLPHDRLANCKDCPWMCCENGDCSPDCERVMQLKAERWTPPSPQA
jgi:hypothetical protein